MTEPKAVEGQPGAPADSVVQLQPSGWRYRCPPERSLLQAAIVAGIRLPSSCRNGTCRTCMCKMLQGTVRYTTEWPGVSSDEQAEGWILPCVAVPEGDVVLEVPDARTLVPRPPSAQLTGARRA